jgi:hypothetical protein
MEHRISQREKYANKAKWGRDYLDYICPTASSTGYELDREEMLSNYKLFNNELNHEEFIQWSSPFGIDVGQLDEIILPYNKTANKIQVLLGEELKRSENFTAILTSDKDIKQKNLELRGKVKTHINSEIQKEIAKVVMESQGMPEEEIQKAVEEMSIYMESEIEKEKNVGFMSEYEIMANRILQFGALSENVKKKKNLAFKHALISAVEAVYIGIENGKVKIEVLNPLNLFFKKSPETEYIQDGDFAGIKCYKSRLEVIEKYGHKMTKEELKRLKDGSNFPGGGGRISSDGSLHLNEQVDAREVNMLASTSEFSDFDRKNIGSFTTSEHPVRNGDFVEFIHAEWRTLRKVIFLSVISGLGDETVDIVDEEFPIPKEAVKLKDYNQFGDPVDTYEWVDELTGTIQRAEIMWVPRVWEGTRIDGDIYIDVREKPNQNISVEDPYGKTKLGYFGMVYSSTNAKPISLMSRMKPYQMLYFIALNNISKLLSRHQGKLLAIDMAQLPNFEDKYGRSDMELMLYYQSKGLLFYNSLSNSQGGLMPSNRGGATESVDASTANDIIALTNVCQWLDVQIGEAAGVTREREGYISPNTNVNDNKQSVSASANITEIYFYSHHAFWAEVMTYYLDLFRNYAKEFFDMNPDKTEHYLQYLLPNASMQTIKLTPEHLSSAELSVFVDFSGLSESYRQEIMATLPLLAQNDMENTIVVSQLIKDSIQGTSPEEIHKKLEQLLNERHQRQQEMQKQQQEAQQQMLEQQAKMQQEQNEFEFEKIKLEGSIKHKTAIDVKLLELRDNNDPND